MRAEIICVGTELLLGDIANTNAQEIGAMLAEIGVDCQVHTTVGDNTDRIAAAIVAALHRADAVVITGGLGPTQDDVTREALCVAFGVKMISDDRLEGRLRETFARMGRPMPEINLRQAERPDGSTPIDTVIGTAPGLIVEGDAGVAYAIPGVPAEMREMMSRAVLPDLARRAGPPAATVSRILRVAGMAESAIAEALAPLWSSLERGAVTIAYLAGGGEVRVRLTAKASTRSEADALITPAHVAVADALGSALFGVDDDTLEAVVGRLLRERKLSLGCAESLTGGAVGARITRVPGSSDYFVGSIVAYSIDAKVNVLGIDRALVEQYGVVSEEVARAMAAGARRSLGADIGLSLTGVAGPEETGARRGTVCLAVDADAGGGTRTVRLPGERETVRTLAAAAALNLLRLWLMEALP